jgi:hypothetical protein
VVRNQICVLTSVVSFFFLFLICLVMAVGTMSCVLEPANFLFLCFCLCDDFSCNNICAY